MANSEPRKQEKHSVGSSTDQYVDATEETGTFITDEPPRGDVPSHGSSNAGINATKANRVEQERANRD